jgi:predicted DNA binding protein
MMQLRFQAGADSWVKGLCADLSAKVRILGLKSIGKEEEIAHFVDITMEADRRGELNKRLETDTSVVSTELTDLSRDHLLGVVVAKRCKACSSIVGSNSAMFVSSATTESDCALGYKIFLNNEGIPSLLNHLSRGGVEYRVTEISPISPDVPLTTRQLNVLKSAMEMGLYDFPRRITQDELALKMGIKPSTLNEILRRAEKNILGIYLGMQVETAK